MFSRLSRSDGRKTEHIYRDTQYPSSHRRNPRRTVAIECHVHSAGLVFGTYVPERYERHRRFFDRLDCAEKWHF